MAGKEIEIRSEKVQEIIGYIPNWIVRWGISVFLFITLFFLIISWFVKYPDVISSTITLTTVNPPVTIISQTEGKIQSLFVKNNEYVKKNKTLAIIDNTTDYGDYIDLLNQLNEIKLFFTNPNVSNLINIKSDFKLGELQSSYTNFLMSYMNLKQFLLVNYYQKKIRSISDEIKNYYNLNDLYKEQTRLLDKDDLIEKSQYDRDSILAYQMLISNKDFENTKSQLLQKGYALESSKTNLVNTNIQILQLQQNILDLQFQYQSQKTQFLNQLKEAYDNLLGAISTWEYKYLIKSPIDGLVTFTKYWSINQYVKTGDQVLTVVPTISQKIIGKINLPIQGSGKVKIGQKVNIELFNYPSNEYGIIEGKITSISLVPSDSFYTVEVELTRGFKTSFGNILSYKNELSGTANIVTQDYRLLYRIFSPIKLIFNKNIKS